jgi:hypothetical protein
MVSYSGVRVEIFCSVGPVRIAFFFFVIAPTLFFYFRGRVRHRLYGTWLVMGPLLLPQSLGE